MHLIIASSAPYPRAVNMAHSGVRVVPAQGVQLRRDFGQCVCSYPSQISGNMTSTAYVGSGRLEADGWLARLNERIIAAASQGGLEPVVAAFAAALVEAGFAPARVSVSVNAPHPALPGITYVWTREQGDVRSTVHPASFFESAEHLTSPIHTVQSTGRRLLLRHTEPKDPYRRPMIPDFARADTTTYLALPVRAESGDIRVLDASTDRAEGWDDDVIAWLERALPVMALSIELAESRRLIAASAASQDVLRRVHAEATLLESEARYRRIVETAEEGIWTIDAAGRTNFVNRKMAHLLGYTVDEMLGRPLSDFMTEAASAISDANVERRKQGIAEEHDFEFLRKDGSTVWTTLSTSPIVGANGEYLGALAMVTDTSARRKAEQALLETYTQLKATLDALPDLLFEVDASGCVQGYYQPPQQELYAPPEQFVGRTVRDFLPPAVAEVIEAALASAREHGHHRGATYSLETKSGLRWYELSIARKGSPSAQTGELVALARDITALKEAEAQRLEHERKILHTQKLESLGVLAGGIAHDFNNMLTAVMGNISLAMTTLAPTSPAYGSLVAADSATERAAALSRQMLAYSGRGRFVVKTVSLVGVVEEMVQLLQVSISKKAHLRLDFGPRTPNIKVDVTQLRQVILNLVTNASDAIGEREGVISLTTGAMHCNREYFDSAQVHNAMPDGLYAFLEVTDTGTGIAPADLPKIFDPFFTTKFTGRGLGLAAVQGIVRGHKGALKVSSEEGVGTAFRVLFPVPAGQDDAYEEQVATSAAYRGSGLVLLVDDEETIRTTTSAMLKLCGFEVITAADGRAALQVFEAERDRIVLVLLDLTMPQMDGEETLRGLRGMGAEIPVILSSGYSEGDTQQRFKELGLSGFVSKPYSIATLQAVLRRALPP